MGEQKTTSILIGIVFFLLCLSGSLKAYELVPFYQMDDPNHPEKVFKAPSVLDPCNPWAIPPDDPNGLKVGPVKPGQVVWLAFNNFRDSKRQKHFKIELKRASGSLGLVKIDDAFVTGFADANSNGAITTTRTDNINDEHNTEVIRKHYRFKEQSRWERVKVISNSRKDVSFYVKAWSICGTYTGDWNVFRIAQGSFGAEGAMISNEPIKEIHCFAESTDLDMSKMPFMTSQMPGSGPWMAIYPVFVDPEGNPRPHGGVRFVSIGMGLLPGSFFDLSFAMTFPPDQEKDIRYFIYTQDEAERCDEYVIDFTDQFCDGEILKGDINKDCIVDLTDFAELAGNWLRCNDPLDAACQP